MKLSSDTLVTGLPVLFSFLPEATKTAIISQFQLKGLLAENAKMLNAFIS